MVLRLLEGSIVHTKTKNPVKEDKPFSLAGVPAGPESKGSPTLKGLPGQPRLAPWRCLVPLSVFPMDSSATEQENIASDPSCLVQGLFDTRHFEVLKSRSSSIWIHFKLLNDCTIDILPIPSLIYLPSQSLTLGSGWTRGPEMGGFT